MTDFVRHTMRPEKNDWIHRSPCDIDFYKYTMGYYIYTYFPDTEVTFELIVRDKTIPIADVIDERELCEQLEHARQCRYDFTTLSWLGGMRVYGANMFSNEYVYDFLEKYRLPEFRLERKGSGFNITFRGTWKLATFWETIALSVVNELYYRSLMRRMSETEVDILFARAKAKLWDKLQRLKAYPDLKFMGFETRRRFSFRWQHFEAQLCKQEMGAQYLGVSNTWIAFNQSIIPMGTNAHELPMVEVALANTSEEKRRAQYDVCAKWEKLYGVGLRILLPDAFGTPQFLLGAPERLAHEWKGLRQDSGCPIEIGELYIAWLESHHIDPCTKLLIFSDGLDVDDMIKLHLHFNGRINVSFGWGTLLGNDFRDCYPREGEIAALFRPISMACKVVEANGRPVVKFSDTKGKVTGDPVVAEEYRKIFGVGNAVERAIIV